MEEEVPVVPAVARPQPVREVLPEPKIEPRRRRFFGSWSERKPEVRTEPAPMQRSAQPRATAQLMGRAQPEPQRTQSAQPELPDLNPQEDFEIPAFLRRQSN